MIRQLAAALSFLTVLPVAVADLTAEELAGSCRFFPLVGWLIGALLATLAAGALAVDGPPTLVACLLVAFSAWFSRGLHLDGVADLADGLAGSLEPARRLAIMKDSAIGAFGVAALVLLLLLKVMALGQLLASPARDQALLLVALGPAAARGFMLIVAWWGRYPRASGTGHFMVGCLSPAILLTGLLLLLPGCWLGWPALAVFAVLLTFNILLLLRAGHALGGVTGDVLGAAIEWGEGLAWLTAAWLLA
ncbi:MAG: adenosylcobinamide-GDP ribazoletransferase [Thermodesulfobacteriota bacterium]